MPLVIPEGGGATLTCTHVLRPPFSLSWFRENTTIRQDTPDTLDECSCQVPRVEPGSSSDREVIFMDFAREFAGEYSCRAPIDPSTSTFDVCRFNVLAAGELIIQCVYIHVPMCMHQSVYLLWIIPCSSFQEISTLPEYLLKFFFIYERIECMMDMYRCRYLEVQLLFLRARYGCNAVSCSISGL